MLLKANYEPEHLRAVHKLYPKVDSNQLTTTVYAFGLLQSLIDSGLDFCFKGGTCLLLLLKGPARVSTDIDIVVPKGTDFDKYFERIKSRFPLKGGEEQGAVQNPFFRHFRFFGKVAASQKEVKIRLDVAFEDKPFLRTIEAEVSLSFLISGGEKTFVRVPSLPCILGDKLTAFAPHTCGVNPFWTSLGKPADNRTQVMKQMFDIARLYDEKPDFALIRDSFLRSLDFENKVRGTNYSPYDSLWDSLEAAFSIASLGLIDPNGDYVAVFKPGIQGLSTNTFKGSYTTKEAANDASRVALLCAGLLVGFNVFSSEGFPDFRGKELRFFKFFTNPESFSNIRKALGLLASYKKSGNQRF